MTESTSFGQCRCCLSEGNHIDLKSKCSMNGELEAYYNIFVQCFNLQLKTHTEFTTLICSQCIERLKDAHDFRSMVVQVEKQLLEDASIADFHMGEADKQATLVDPHMMAAIKTELKEERQDDEPASHMGLSEELDIKMENEEADDPEARIDKKDTNLRIVDADKTLKNKNCSSDGFIVRCSFTRMLVLDIWLSITDCASETDRRHRVFHAMKQLLPDVQCVNTDGLQYTIYNICRPLKMLWTNVHQSRPRMLDRHRDWLNKREVCILSAVKQPNETPG